MNVDLTPSPSKLIMQVFLARQVQMVSHSLPERDTLSTRRVALSLHLLRFRDQRHPVTARFSPLPFAADCFCFLPPDEAALLFCLFVFTHALPSHFWYSPSGGADETSYGGIYASPAPINSFVSERKL